MGRKKKPDIVVHEQGRAWDPDDFFLDSHGVQAPLRERFEKLREDGFTPEQVSINIQDRYRRYLEHTKKPAR